MYAVKENQTKCYSYVIGEELIKNSQDEQEIVIET